MSTPSFDFAIVGAGAAGLHLAIQLAEEPSLRHKKVLLLDKDTKVANDRTWSFWEKGKSKWDAITIQQWNKAIFRSTSVRHEIPLGDYQYKTIRSSDFYDYAKQSIKEAGFTWVNDDVVHVNEQEIIGNNGSYATDHIFDSRIPASFNEDKAQYPTLIQHFIGWFIKTPTPVFDASEVTMMDYRVKWKNHTSFHYILPFSPSYALVEFTLFNQEMLKENEYEEILKAYITENLGIEAFDIVEKEVGQIPMSAYPFKKHHTKTLTKIGTAGGWVRPSSGYAFKNSERFAQAIVQNIVAKKSPSKGVATSRFRFYDRIFLQVLQDRNDLGEQIFETLYAKQPAKSLFRFLDEESSLLEDAKIMFSLNQPIFRKALLQTLRSS